MKSLRLIPEGSNRLAGGRAAHHRSATTTFLRTPEGCHRVANMGSTFLSLHYHVTFSTKHRRPLIENTWRDELHKYLSGAIKGMGGYPCGTGGVADHVHLLFGLKATHCLADVMRELKKSATAWVHEDKQVGDFGWQEGYAALTVSPTAIPGVQHYIDNQEEHHKRKTFREELKELLDMAGVEYQDKYLD